MQCYRSVSINQIIVSQTHFCKANSSNGVYNNIRLKTLNGCELRISQHRFLYNAEGGRGIGSYIKSREHDDFESQVPIRYDFDLKTVHIPPLTSTTCKLEGLVLVPLPPFVKVDVVPELIRGNIYHDSGKVEFKIKSKFLFSMGSNYKVSPIHINMTLTTEELKGASSKSTRGKRLGKEGYCQLVGIAKIGPVDDNYINLVLGLPSECLANMKAIVSFF